MKKVYLDVCCWNRPFDDQTQTRIHLEAEAVLAIVAEIERRRWALVSSEVVDTEINTIRSAHRRERVRNFVPHWFEQVKIDKQIVSRALALESLGFSGADALHLAAAESARVDVLLTTDDRLLRLARKHARLLHVHADNPLTWLQTVVQEER